MLNFLEYLREGFLIEAKSKPISTKNPSDSFGKIHEILVGKHLNNGSFPEDYRVEGKRPVDIHNAHAKARFGKQFESYPKYQAMDKTWLWIIMLIETI